MGGKRKYKPITKWQKTYVLVQKTIWFLLGFAITTFVGLLLIKSAYGAEKYPEYKPYVNDFANVLTASTEARLNTIFLELDKRTTNQIAIATVETTGEEPIEEYSIHLAEKWHPGQEGKDNGVLMVIAVKDKKARIEVGRGLEGDITDLESKHIQDEKMTPKFKEKKYDEGVLAGSQELVMILDPELASKSALATNSATIASESEVNPAIGVIIIIVVAIFLVLIVLAIIGGEESTAYFLLQIFFQVLLLVLTKGKAGGNFGKGKFSGGGSSSSW